VVKGTCYLEQDSEVGYSNIPSVDFLVRHQR